MYKEIKIKEFYVIEQNEKHQFELDVLRAVNQGFLIQGGVTYDHDLGVYRIAMILPEQKKHQDEELLNILYGAPINQDCYHTWISADDWTILLCPSCGKTKDKDVEVTCLDPRIKNSLNADGVWCLRQLCSMTKSQVSKIPNIGKKHLNAIIEKLTDLGLSLKDG